MAHYAYKHACYDIDYEKYKELVAQFEKEEGREHDGDSNYDGDNWYIVAMWIEQLRAELAKEREKVQRLQFALADTEALELGTAERLAAVQAKVTRLEADVQRLQKLKEDYGPTMVAMQKQAWAEADRQSQINRLSEQLAAAQAVIEQMREGIKETMDACFDALNGHSENYYHALKNEMARCRKALSIQCNQDALHEARAQAVAALEEKVEAMMKGSAYLPEIGRAHV